MVFVPSGLQETKSLRGSLKLAWELVKLLAVMAGFLGMVTSLLSKTNSLWGIHEQCMVCDATMPLCSPQKLLMNMALPVFLIIT